jgi:hypothetical protein
MNPAFKNHIRRYWAVYLAFAILCPLLVDWGVSARVAVKKNEKLTLFIAAKSVDEEAMKKNILEGDPTLQEVKTLSYDPSDSSFRSYLTSAGVIGTDFALLPPDAYNETIIQTYFLPLDLAKWNAALGTSLSAVEVANQDYGFLIYDKTQAISFLDPYLSYSDETGTSYGLFINRNSVNFQSLFSVSSTQSDHALKALQTLFGGKV